MAAARERKPRPSAAVRDKKTKARRCGSGALLLLPDCSRVGKTEERMNLGSQLSASGTVLRFLPLRSVVVRLVLGF